MMILGLNSGTSRDGVSGVIFQTGRLKAPARIKLFAHSEYPYPAWLLRELLRVEAKPDLESVSRLNFVLGEFFAESALRLMRENKFQAGQIDLIGSHGQTIGHFPQKKRIGKYQIRATIQAAELSVIANRTGITTIGDFRPGEIAAGGEGAPVLTYPEYLLFFSKEKNRMALNLGGIANYSLIPKSGKVQEIRASDCGPCNLLLDGLSQIISGGRQKFDRNGRMALRGRPREKWVRAFLRHRFFKRPAPKSSGREEFSQAWLKGVLQGLRFNAIQEGADLLRSAVCAVAEMVGECYFDNEPEFGLEEIIVSGGGANHQALILELSRSLGRKVMVSDDLGVPAKAKEPIGFGILAELCLYGQSGGPAFSRGAKGQAVLGKIVPGENWNRLSRGLGKEKGERR